MGINPEEIRQQDQEKYADPTDPHISPSYYGPELRKFMHHYGIGRGWYLGNAVKYIVRAGKKAGEPEARDIKKAIRNLEFYLEELGE